MNKADLMQILRELQFLKDLDEADLEQLADVSRYAQFAPGEAIFREGDTASEFHVIQEGNVSLEVCAPGVGCRRIMTATRGDLLGWSPILGEPAFTATARALAPTRVVTIHASQILAVCEQRPRFGFDLMRRAALALAHRLSATRLQLIDVYGNQMAPAGDAEPGGQEGE